MAYTYDDFLTRLNQSGLQNQFSQWDLDTARQYPEFGISMLSLKQDYNNATTDQARAMANEMANQLRANYGNYLGGRYGDQYISLGRSPSDYESRYGSLIDDAINRMNNYGDFSFDVERPTYESRYDEQMQGLLDEIVNRQPYLYNLETDPVWSAYKKQYTREGQRATADTMAQVSAMTGGMPSSYAATAAQQAGDYYAGQMADIIPQLYQQAYDRYLNEYQMKQQDLSAVQSMEQMDYGKYIDSLGQWNTDRNFAYNQWQDGYNMLYNNLGAMQGQDDREYGRMLDDLNLGLTQSQMRQEQMTAGQESAAAQVESILAAGGIPSAELIAASGLSQEYVDVMAAYYAQRATGSGGGGYSGGSGGTSGSTTEESIYQQIAASGLTPLEYLYSQGVTNNALLNSITQGYNEWVKSGGGQGISGGTTRPYTAQQYELFLNELSVAKDNSVRLNLLEDAYTNGRITEEQVRQLAKQYGIQLY